MCTTVSTTAHLSLRACQMYLMESSIVPSIMKLLYIICIMCVLLYVELLLPYSGLKVLINPNYMGLGHKIRFLGECNVWENDDLFVSPCYFGPHHQSPQP